MNKTSQRRNTNGVSFLSGGSSVFSSSESKPIGIIQFFSAKTRVTTKIKKPVVFIVIEYEEYACTLHPHPNPRMLHESIGISIEMNSPPVGNSMLNLSINPTITFFHIIVNNTFLNKINDSEYSVSRRDF